MGEGILALVYLFGIVLAVLWFLLPFAVFGVKDRLDTLIKVQKKTNTLLEQSLKVSEPVKARAPVKAKAKVNISVPEKTPDNGDLARRLNQVCGDEGVD